MAYLSIKNLYKDQNVLLFKECYALEKIHGTSAHVRWNKNEGTDGVVHFFSGGEKHEHFKTLFDEAALKAAFVAMGHDEVTVFGEAYGGKCQGMKATYGEHLKFIAFDVKVGDTWLNVPNAHDVATKLGLEFVHYVRTPTTLAALDALRDAPSEQAFRVGCANRADETTFKIAEGIVLRPVVEMRMPNGDRVIAKHKRAEFNERKTIPAVDCTKREIMLKAGEIAMEWVTEMRLRHVLDKLGNPKDMSRTPDVIAAMVEDVVREGAGEIADNHDVRKAISARAVKLYKEHVMKIEEPVTC